jgi:signal transduction histidine kinase
METNKFEKQPPAVRQPGQDTDQPTQPHDFTELYIQLETLKKQYAMEKTLWVERTRIKEDEIKSIKAQIGERESVLKLDFKQKEEELTSQKIKIIEVEAKLNLEQSLAQERIKSKEDEIKDTKQRFEQLEYKLKSDLDLLQSKLQTKDDSMQQLNRHFGKVELELRMQVEMKQQEVYMQKNRFEEEMRNLTEKMSHEQARLQSIISEKTEEIASLKSRLMNEITNLQLKYVEEQNRAERAAARLEEIQKDGFRSQATFDVLLRQVDDLKYENRTLKEMSYLPENIAKLKYLDAMEGLNKLTADQAVLKSALEQEKHAHETILATKQTELTTLQDQVNKMKEDLSKGSYDLALQLQKEKESLTVKLNEVGGLIQNEVDLRKKQLETKDEIYGALMDDLARGYIHKVRNMLGVINGAIELSGSALDESSKQFESDAKLKELYTQFKDNFDMGIQHINHIMKSLDELRDLSKPVLLEREQAQMNGILQRSCLVARDRMQKQSIILIEEYAADIPEFMIDVKKMESAFGEIIINSIEALPKGGNITIKTLYDKPEKIVTVIITDNGSGISDTQVGKVFQPFFTNKLDRSGLGLPRAKRLITMHNGAIMIQSEKGKGTTVTVRLPIE